MFDSGEPATRRHEGTAQRERTLVLPIAAKAAQPAPELMRILGGRPMSTPLRFDPQLQCGPRPPVRDGRLCPELFVATTGQRT